MLNAVDPYAEDGVAEGIDIEVAEGSTTNEHAYPAGGILRALRAGGERAARALMSLHRKYYHASADTMKRLLDMAGVPEAVIAEIPEVLKNCKVCRTWERPRTKPMARTELSLNINKCLPMSLSTLCKMVSKYPSYVSWMMPVEG